MCVQCGRPNKGPHARRAVADISPDVKRAPTQSWTSSRSGSSFPSSHWQTARNTSSCTFRATPTSSCRASVSQMRTHHSTPDAAPLASLSCKQMDFVATPDGHSESEKLWTEGPWYIHSVDIPWVFLMKVSVSSFDHFPLSLTTPLFSMAPTAWSTGRHWSLRAPVSFHQVRSSVSFQVQVESLLWVLRTFQKTTGEIR